MNDIPNLPNEIKKALSPLIAPFVDKALENCERSYGPLTDKYKEMIERTVVTVCWTMINTWPALQDAITTCPGMKEHWEKFIKFMDSVSPEELGFIEEIHKQQMPGKGRN